MIALISPAKTMIANTSNTENIGSTPRFLDNTKHIISKVNKYSSRELEEIFKISAPIALELKCRIDNFNASNQSHLNAIDAYNGVVYKHIKANEELSEAEKQYIQNNVRISSLLYGLLKPLDNILPYRMEGFVRLHGSDTRVDKYWRDIQTDTLIEDVKNAGGQLIYLASKEEQNAFNWKKVKENIQIIDIQFLQYKGDKLRQVIVYTKMARGEMVRYMMKNNIQDSEKLKDFQWNGYVFNPNLSSDNTWVWVMK